MQVLGLDDDARNADAVFAGMALLHPIVFEALPEMQLGMVRDPSRGSYINPWHALDCFAHEGELCAMPTQAPPRPKLLDAWR